MIAAGAALGVGITLAALLATRGGGDPGVPVATIRPACGVSIVLFEPDSPESRLIDAATGSVGFSHSAIDGCESDAAGHPLFIDCRPGDGVSRVPASSYAGRPSVRVWLPLVAGRELYGCARGRVGLPYDTLGLVVPKTGPVGGVICSQLIYDCMPTDLREQIPDWPRHRPVSPNDLARGFGARPGAEDITLQGGESTQ